MATIRYIKILLLIFPVLLHGQVVYQEEEAGPHYTDWSSVDLDGTSQYIALPPSVADFSAAAPFSIELWVKPILAGTSTVIIAQKGSGSDGYKIELSNANTGQPYVGFQLGLGANYYRVDADRDGITGSKLYGNKLWHDSYYHIVCTYDGTAGPSGMKIYINASGATTTSSSNGTPTVSNSDSLYIGYNWSNYTKIGFCLFRSYNSELSAADISTLFNNGLPARNKTSTQPETEVRVYDLTAFRNVTTSDIINENKFPGNRHIYAISRAEQNQMTHLGGGVFGQEGGTSLHVTSPMAHLFYASGIVYDSSLNVSYLAAMSKGHSGFNREGQIGIYDHNTREFRFTDTFKSLSEENADGHNVYSLILDANDSLIVARENMHLTPGYIAKGMPGGGFYEASTIGSYLGYMNLVRIADTTYAFYRMNGNDNDTGQGVSYSTDEGQSWSGQILIADIDTTPRMGAYPVIAQSPVTDTVFLLICRRTASVFFSGFYGISAYKTGDFRTFYSMDNTLIGTRGSDTIQYQEILSTTNVDNVTDSVNHQMFLYCSRVDTAGRLALVYRDEESAVDSIRFAIWENNAWVKRNLNIGTNQQRQAPTGALAYKGGTSWDLFVIETVASIDVVRKYSTTDDFQTMDSGVTVSENATHTQIVSTKRHQLGQPFLLAANRLISSTLENSVLWLYEYTP